MGGDVTTVTNTSNMFNGVPSKGNFIYNCTKDYSKILNVIPSGWTKKCISGTGTSFKIINNVTSNGNYTTMSVEIPSAMTWSDFISSSYNTIGASAIGTNYVAIYDSDGSVGYLNTTSTGTTHNILLTDKIINNATYYISYWLCCFVAGTKVLTSLEGETKNIEDLNIGDTVISYNMETKENYETVICNHHINTKSNDMAKITCADGTILEMTAYHPLYTKDGWKSLTKHNDYEELVIGDIVKTIDDWSEVISIERYILATPINTYTINVKDKNEEIDIDINDGFYANGVLAHNASSK